MLEAATLALAHLDSDALSDLERRANTLQQKIAGDMPLMTVPEIEARHRVFAAVVQATGESLGVLRRSNSRDPYGAPWAR